MSGALHVDVVDGAGPAIVLVHGTGGSSRYWENLLPHLSGRRIVAPDLLGFGRSPWPDVDYTVGLHVDALADALAGEDGGVHLVGHSLGALLAVELAARDPAKVRALTLVSMPCFATADDAARRLSRAQPWAWLLLHAPRASSWACAAICQRRRITGPALVRMHPELPPHVVLDALLHSYRSMSTTFQNVVVNHRPFPALRDAAAAGVPITFVHGDDDVVAPSADARAAAADVGARFVSVHGGDHLVSLRAPDVVAAAVVHHFDVP